MFIMFGQQILSKGNSNGDSNLNWPSLTIDHSKLSALLAGTASMDREDMEDLWLMTSLCKFRKIQQP